MPHAAPSHNGRSATSNARDRSVGLLRSRQVSEFIDAKPPAIVRYGITGMLALLLLAALASWFMYYPDIIRSTATLVPEYGPESIVHPTAGRIQRLLVKQNDKVSQGTVIACLTTFADHEQVLELSKGIDTVYSLLKKDQFYEARSKMNDFLQTPLQAGELQEDWQTFRQHWQKYAGAVAAVRDGNPTLPSGQHSIRPTSNRIGDQAILMEGVLQFSHQLDKWEAAYLVKAPCAGNVVFDKPVREQQCIAAGMPIGYVMPAPGACYAQIVITQSNIGKVNKGQPVYLKFDAYPYQQFGSVEGKIEFVSAIPNGDGYSAIVSVPQDLMTNFHKKLEFRSGLTAKAEIKTGELRLARYLLSDLGRLFGR